MSITSELHKIWKLLSDPEFRAMKRQHRAFRAAHGRSTPERYQGLRQGDVVLDVGGYRGDWAARMTALYGVTVHVFEVHPRFAAQLRDRFAGRTTVQVHPFAIGSGAGTLDLSDDENASTALAVAGPVIRGEVRPVGPVFEELGLSEIAVVKMNIEGGEYDLLPALLAAGLIGRIERLTIQFHRYTAEQPAQRDAIREALKATHDCSWEYPFLWEEWVRKPG